MSSIIDKKTIQALILEYRAQNSSPDGPGLITPDGQYLNGYFIDRDSIEAVLSNPDIVGLSLHFAVTPGYSGSGKNIFTIAFCGSTPNPNWVEGSTTEKTYLASGDVYEFSAPCPPNCQDLI